MVNLDLFSFFDHFVVFQVVAEKNAVVAEGERLQNKLGLAQRLMAALGSEQVRFLIKNTPVSAVGRFYLPDSLPLSLSPSLPLSLSPPLFLPPSLPPFLSLSLTLSRSHTPALSHSHTLTLSHSHTLTLSHSHTPTLPQYHTLTLTLSILSTRAVGDQREAESSRLGTPPVPQVAGFRRTSV